MVEAKSVLALVGQDDYVSWALLDLEANWSDYASQAARLKSGQLKNCPGDAEGYTESPSRG